MRHKKYFVLAIVFLSVFFLLGCGDTYIQELGIDVEIPTENIDTTEQALSEMVFSPFNYFPIDLDAYFSQPNLATYQNYIKNGNLSLISPYMIHFGSIHTEGTGKWYIYPHGTNYAMYSPGRALIIKSEEDVNNAKKAVIEVDGKQVYKNARLTLWFDSNKSVNFQHMNLLCSIVEEVLTSNVGYIVIDSGTHIGYTSTGTALDFAMEDKSVWNGFSPEVDSCYFEHRVCPLPYFNSTIADKLVNYYDTYIYSAMKEGGKWPESKLCGSININIDDTIWGTWHYTSGPRETYQGSFWYFFPRGFLTFLNKSKTNPETFFNSLATWEITLTKDCPDWDGLYSQGNRYVVLVSGSYSSEGIVALKKFGSSGTIDKYKFTEYMCFKLDLKTSSKYDDELQAKFYDDLTEAQTDSFSDPTIYVKDESKGNPLP